MAVPKSGARLEFAAGPNDAIPDIALEAVESESGRQGRTRGQKRAHHLRNLKLLCQTIIRSAGFRRAS